MTKLSNSNYAQCFRVLGKRDRVLICLSIFVQICLSFMDLIGVLIIGLLGSLAVTGIQSKQSNNQVATVLDWLDLEAASFQFQVATLGFIAMTILIMKTLISVITSKRMMFFLSRQSARISAYLIAGILKRPLLETRKRDTQEIVFAVTRGPELVTLGVIGTSVSLIADTSLLVVLSIGLFILNPMLATISTIVFSLIAYLIYQHFKDKAFNLGIDMAQFGYRSNGKIFEALQTYREIFVRGKLGYYIETISDLRYKVANVSAELAFMPNLSKYVFEISIVAISLLISAIQFFREDASQAIGTLAVFFAASTRIAPATMRLQQGLTGIKASMGGALETLVLIDEVSKEGTPTKILEQSFSHSNRTFSSSIEIVDLNFSFGNENWSLNIANLQIDEGEFVALAGPSGAGKTTLVDLILGLIEPISGRVVISGEESRKTIERWPGKIAYVPQNIFIIQGSIRENVALGYSNSEISDEKIWNALKLAQLGDFVKSLPQQLDENVGEFGNKLSGGQRQRLGIARALYTEPKLIVMDEATSALDHDTEQKITESMKSLKGEITLVVIAHRLSSIKMCDRVIYIDKGSIVTQGKFEEVKSIVPHFDEEYIAE